MPGRPDVRKADRMDVREGRPEDRAFVERVLVGRWSSHAIVSRARIHDAASLPSLIAEIDGQPVGLLTHASSADGLEVVSLDSLRERQGVGSALLEVATRLAADRGCRRIWLVTTNENLAALGFYQRRGFRLAALRPGAVDAARRLKPSIPIVAGGVPVADEIELERVLTKPEGPEVNLQPVTEDERSLLGNLLQLYIHDFSSIRPVELADDGRYPYRHFDAYFTDPQRRAWIIQHGGLPAGFAMVRELEGGRREVAEFFVARAHRRRAVGRRAAAAMFEELPGRWELRHDLDNDEASVFWPAVIEAAAAGPVERLVLGPPDNPVEHAVFRFSTV
jgi:predicted acetyltransferase/predicted N-acetyltransferase YhbS